MSLTSFLQNRDVRQRFRQELIIPSMAVKREILAPPLSSRYSLVGTAFDYLMRFFLKRLNQDAVTTGWVAELALLNDIVIDRRSGEIVHFRGTKLGRKAQRIIEQAKNVFPWVTCQVYAQHNVGADPPESGQALNDGSHLAGSQTFLMTLAPAPAGRQRSSSKSRSASSSRASAASAAGTYIFTILSGPWIRP